MANTQSTNQTGNRRATSRGDYGKVQAYLEQIRAEAVRLAAEKAERDRKEFRANLTCSGFHPIARERR